MVHITLLSRLSDKYNEGHFSPNICVSLYGYGALFYFYVKTNMFLRCKSKLTRFICRLVVFGMVVFNLSVH